MQNWYSSRHNSNDCTFYHRWNIFRVFSQIMSFPSFQIVQGNRNTIVSWFDFSWWKTLVVCMTAVSMSDRLLCLCAFINIFFIIVYRCIRRLWRIKCNLQLIECKILYIEYKRIVIDTLLVKRCRFSCGFIRFLIKYIFLRYEMDNTLTWLE